MEELEGMTLFNLRRTNRPAEKKSQCTGRRFVCHRICVFCLLTISLIHIGAKGEVHPLETG